MTENNPWFCAKIIVFCLFFSPAAFAGKLAVDRNASACSDVIGLPFCTINAAIKNAKTGDTIIVSPGEYPENVDFGGNGVAVKSAMGPKKTFIQGQGNTAVAMGPLASLSGFTITNYGEREGLGIEVDGGGNVISTNIIEYHSQRNSRDGVGIRGENVEVTIDSNYFRNNKCDAKAKSAVISLGNSSKPLIKNNIFENNLCTAIDMANPVSGLAIIVNNTFVGNRRAVYVDRKFNTSQQIYLNNILYKNEVGLEIVGKQGINNTTWDNNLVYGNDINYTGIRDLAGQYGNISVDPEFANVSTGDFRLRSTSAAIDAGTGLNAPNLDFLQNTRPMDGNRDRVRGVDIGACESTPPTAIAGADIVVSGGSRIVLDGAGSFDSDGEIKKYHWKTVKGNILKSTAMNTAQLKIVVPNQTGSIQLQLTVRDDLGFTSSDRVKITVNSKKKTVADRGNIYRPKNMGKMIFSKKQSKSFKPEVGYQSKRSFQAPIKIKHTDSEDRPFSVSTSNKIREPEVKVASISNRNMIPKREKDESPNLLPEINLGTSFAVESGELAAINGTFSRDPDGEIVKYQWKQIKGTQVKLSRDNSDIAVFTAPKNPTLLVFELAVTDNKGGVSKGIITIQVQSK